MVCLEFVDLERFAPDIAREVRYATTNNFTGEVLYPSPQVFLRSSVAMKLRNVQMLLRKRRLGLKVWDAYRPLSVQKRLWERVSDPRYVANPAKGSKHNRGAAVDLTLVDGSGKELLMPTHFDDFSARAHRSCPDLPVEARENSRLLEEAMVAEGFLPLPHEWWHFDDKEWEEYPVEDISFEELQKQCSASL